MSMTKEYVLQEQSDHWLRLRLTELREEFELCEQELKHRNRPEHLDAAQILADLDAREKARRRPVTPSKRQEKTLDDQLWSDCVLIETEVLL